MTTVVSVVVLLVMAFLLGISVGLAPKGLPELPFKMSREEKVTVMKRHLEETREESFKTIREIKRLLIYTLVGLIMTLWIFSLYGWPVP